MLTFLIIGIVVVLVWAIESYCKYGNPDPTNIDRFTQDWRVITHEVNGIKTDVQTLGWNILWPLVPLIGLVWLVTWALTK